MCIFLPKHLFILLLHFTVSYIKVVLLFLLFCCFASWCVWSECLVVCGPHGHLHTWSYTCSVSSVSKIIAHLERRSTTLNLIKSSHPDYTHTVHGHTHRCVRTHTLHQYSPLEWSPWMRWLVVSPRTPAPTTVSPSRSQHLMVFLDPLSLKVTRQ